MLGHRINVILQSNSSCKQAKVSCWKVFTNCLVLNDFYISTQVSHWIQAVFLCSLFSSFWDEFAIFLCPSVLPLSTLQCVREHFCTVSPVVLAARLRMDSENKMLTRKWEHNSLKHVSNLLCTPMELQIESEYTCEHEQFCGYGKGSRQIFNFSNFAQERLV